MNWFYADAGQQAGPIEDAELARLVGAGKITGDTLVWREGMANWQPYWDIQRGEINTEPVAPPILPRPAVPPVAALVLAPNEIICAECNKVFNQDSAIPFERFFICANCKPVFVQELKEGLHLQHWRRAQLSRATGSPIACTRCHVLLLGDVFNTPDLTHCPACRSLIQIEIFPAFFKPISGGRTGSRTVMEGEAICFYHPEKRAVVPCDVCGRFLCGLCDVDLNHQHLCPNCLSTGRRKGRLSHLDQRRTLWDTAALTLSLLPIIIFPVLILTAPAAIILALWHWNTPTSLVPRTKIRPILTLLFGLGGLFLWFLWTHLAFGWP